ncbi:MAG: hypothetical protein ACH350_07940 [Parachlamydiaceae bacterium]
MQNDEPVICSITKMRTQYRILTSRLAQERGVPNVRDLLNALWVIRKYSLTN